MSRIQKIVSTCLLFVFTLQINPIHIPHNLFVTSLAQSFEEETTSSEYQECQKRTKKECQKENENGGGNHEPVVIPQPSLRGAGVPAFQMAMAHVPAPIHVEKNVRPSLAGDYAFTDNTTPDSVQDVAVGEVVEYEIELTFLEEPPNGELLNLTITDNIPLGMAVLGVNPNTGAPDVIRVSNDCDGRLAMPFVGTAFAPGTFQINNPFASLGANGQDLQIQSTAPFFAAPDGIVSNNSLCLYYHAAVLDTPDTDLTGFNPKEQIIQNSVRVDYTTSTHSDTLSGIVADVRQRETETTINVDVQPSTALIGDQVVVTVTAQHTSASRADAHQNIIMMNIPNQLVVNASFATDGLDNNGSGFDDEIGPTPFLSAGGNLFTWNFANTGVPAFETLPYTTGDTIVLQFEATIAGGTGSIPLQADIFSNTYPSVVTDQDGLNSVFPNTISPTAFYAQRATSNTSIVLGQPSPYDVQKTIVNSSLGASPMPQWATTIPDNTIGDTIDYQVSFTLPEGTYPDLTITDTSDVLGYPAVFGPGTFDATITPTFGLNFPTFNPITDITMSDQFHSDGINDTFEMSLGTLVIPAGSGPQTFVFQYQAYLTDLLTNVSNGTIRENTVSLDYTGIPSSLQLTDTAQLDIVEPELSVDIQTSPSTALPGDARTYTITLTNTGTSPAYDIELTNTVPAQLRVNDSFQSDALDNDGDGTLVELFPHPFYAAASQTFTWNQNTAPTSSFRQLNPGQSITIQYETQVNPSLTSFVGTIPNHVFATATSMPSFSLFERTTYAADSTFTLSINEPNIEINKTAILLVDADTNSVVSPGDTVQYTLDVTNVGNTQATGVTISDVLPADIENFQLRTPLSSLPGPVIDTSIPAPGGANNEGELILEGLTLQPFPATNSQVDIVYTVEIDGGVLDGTNVINNAEASPATEGGTGDTSSQNLVVSAPVQFSDLTQSNKQVVDLDGDNIIDGGDILQYTITIENTGNAPATDVTLTDHIPANVHSFTITSLPSSGFVVPGPAPAGNNATGLLEITNITIPAGSTQTVVYTVVVDQNLPPFTPIANAMTVSEPGEPDVTDTRIVYTPVDTIRLAKGFAAGSNFYTSGEIVHYQVALTNDGSTPSLQGLLLQDPIPAGMSYIPNSLEMVLNGVATPITDLQDTDNGDFNQTTPNTLTFVAPNVTPGEIVYFRYQLRTPQFFTAQPVTNTITAINPGFMTPVIQNGAPVSASANILVVPAPGDFIRLEKNVINPPAVIRPGDLLEYEIYIENNFNLHPNPFPYVDVIDLLPAELQYIAGSLQEDTGSALVSLTDAVDADKADYNQTNPGDLTIRLTNFGLGDSARFVFQARVDDTISTTTRIRNRVRVRNSLGEWIRDGRARILQARSVITAQVDSTTGGGGTTGGGSTGGGGVPNGPGGGGSGGTKNPGRIVWNTPYNLNVSISGDPNDRIKRDIDDLSKAAILPKTGFVSQQLADAYDAQSMFADMTMNDTHYMPAVALHTQGVLRTNDNRVFPSENATYKDLLGMLMIASNKGIDKNFDAHFQKVYNYQRDAEELGITLVVDDQYVLEKTADPVPFHAVLSILLDTIEKSPRSPRFSAYHKAAEERNLLPEDLLAIQSDQFITKAQLTSIVFRALQMQDENTETYIDTLYLDAKAANIDQYEINRSLVSETSVWLSTLNDGGAFYKDIQEMDQNTIIFAHSSQYDWHKTQQGPVFSAVATKMNVGDTFTITEGNTKKTYSVVKRGVVHETDVESLQNLPQSIGLTVFTCDTNDLSQRIIFYAIEA